MSISNPDVIPLLERLGFEAKHQPEYGDTWQIRDRESGLSGSITFEALTNLHADAMKDFDPENGVDSVLRQHILAGLQSSTDPQIRLVRNPKPPSLSERIRRSKDDS